MIENLKVENFRALENLQIDQFSRVNLVVGRNNVGKSSLLEAIRLYLSMGSPLEIEKILLERGELSNVERKEEDDEFILPVEKLFTKRTFLHDNLADKTIYIGSIDKAKKNNYVTMKKVYYVNTEISIKDIKKMSELPSELKGLIKAIGKKRKEIDSKEITRDASVTIKIECKNSILSKPDIAKRFSPNGTLITWLDFEEYNRDMYKKGQARIQEITKNLFPSVRYVPTCRLSDDELSIMWDGIVSGPQEEHVIDALRFIESNIKKLDFVRDLSSITYRRIPVIGLMDGSRGIPLSSSGDGVIRIFQLVLSLLAAKDGYLLIDEFENGLHYSVQPAMWELMFKLAKQYNVKIFATTHSWDCVGAFAGAWRIEENQKDGSFHRIDKKGVMPYDYESLNDSVELDGEPR